MCMHIDNRTRNMKDFGKWCLPREHVAYLNLPKAVKKSLEESRAHSSLVPPHRANAQTKVDLSK